MNYAQHFEASNKLRDAYWRSIGKLHSDVLGSMINPAFRDGPFWPSRRQAFVVIDTPGGTILASDGLSDPYQDFDTDKEVQAYNGLGLELYIESAGQFEDFDQIQQSWELSLLYQATQLAASNPKLPNLLNQYTFLSTELYDCAVPDTFKNEEERTGVLLGLPSAIVADTLELSIEPIRLVNVSLLTLDELRYIAQHGTEGRNTVAERLKKYQGKSWLSRESVV